MTGPQTRGRRVPAQNGRGDNAPQKVEPSPEQVEEAIRHEDAIRDEADQLWEAVDTLSPALFRKLYPLVRRPIHAGHIVEVSAGKGKPYPSIGIKSLQVQIDRLDNVVGPLNWGWRVEWLNEQGTLAEATAWIGPQDAPLFTRSARGGVDRGSTLGNTYKGTETNAAKLALARLGVGHEVYVGAADMDPDVNEDAAEAQAQAAPVAPLRTISADDAAKLRDLFDQVGADPRKLKVKLGSIGVSGVGSVNQAFASLTPAQAAEVDAWLSEQADAQAAHDEAEQPQLGGE